MSGGTFGYVKSFEFCLVMYYDIISFLFLVLSSVRCTNIHVTNQLLILLLERRVASFMNLNWPMKKENIALCFEYFYSAHSQFIFCVM